MQILEIMASPEITSQYSDFFGKCLWIYRSNICQIALAVPFKWWKLKRPTCQSDTPGASPSQALCQPPDGPVRRGHLHPDLHPRRQILRALCCQGGHIRPHEEQQGEDLVFSSSMSYFLPPPRKQCQKVRISLILWPNIQSWLWSSWGQPAVTTDVATVLQPSTAANIDLKIWQCLLLSFQ